MDSDRCAARLRVDGVELGSGRILDLLELSGRMPPVLGWILREHVLERELARHDRSEVSEELLTATVAAFKITNGLPDDAAMEEWLGGQGRSRVDFDQEVVRLIRIERLKHVVTSDDLDSQFDLRRPFLDRVTVTVFRCMNHREARSLVAALRVLGGSATTARLAQFSRWHGALTTTLADAPDLVREAVEDDPVPGLVVGPVDDAGLVTVYRLEEFVQVSLQDPDIRRQVRDELFEMWLAEKLERLDIELLRN